mgnify:CR=1 FL=1
MERPSDHWQAHLPLTLLTEVVGPQRVEAHHDDGVPASKWRGYDAEGALCWYRHHFSQWDFTFDDEDEPCMRLLRSETFEAWRRIDGRWIRRVQGLEGPGRCAGQAHDSGFEVVSAQQVPRL